MDRRIRYLQKRIPDLNVVNDAPDNPEKIFFAARVTLEREDGAEVSYRIMGPDEIDHTPENISVDAPLARALLGRQVDDEVTIEVQGERCSYAVLQIEYPSE